MSTAKFDRIAAIAGSITFGNKNDPATWDAPKLDGLQFVDHANAKKAEALFNRLVSERDQLAAALTKINNLNPEVDSDECWNGGEAHCFRQAQAIAGEILARINAQPLTPPPRNKL